MELKAYIRTHTSPAKRNLAHLHISPRNKSESSKWLTRPSGTGHELDEQLQGAEINGLQTLKHMQLRSSHHLTLTIVQRSRESSGHTSMKGMWQTLHTMPDPSITNIRLLHSHAIDRDSQPNELEEMKQRRSPLNLKRETPDMQISLNILLAHAASDLRMNCPEHEE